MLAHYLNLIATGISLISLLIVTYGTVVATIAFIRNEIGRANGTYSATMPQLDIHGPAGCKESDTDNTVLCSDSWFDILSSDYSIAGGYDVVGYTGPRYEKTPQNGYRIWLDHNTSGKPAGQRECLAVDGSERAHRLCRSLNGRQQSGGKVYVLP